MSALPPILGATPSITRTAGRAAAPIVDETRAPAAVREGSSAAKQAYATGQGFEEMLLQQLSQELAKSSGLGGEGAAATGAGSGEEEPSSEGASSELEALLPGALTEGVMRGGGIGLATQVMDTLDPAAASHAVTAGASAGLAGTDGSARGAGELAASGGVAAPATRGSSGPEEGTSA